MPRIAPDGLVRPGLTVALARYGPAASGALHLVARTPPAWADAGQRISLALWDGSRAGRGTHPHPHPDRRFRLDLHRHLWDARRTGELRERAGVRSWSPRAPVPVGPMPEGHAPAGLMPEGRTPAGWAPEGRTRAGLVPEGCADHRWAAEAALLRQAEGRADDDPVTVRLGTRLRLALHGAAAVPRLLAGAAPTYPVLPDAATWVLPDLELVRAGLIPAGRLHPLVAAALGGDRPAAGPEPPPGTGTPRLVECRGAQHRIGLVAGVLAPLDHDPQELRREELLVALGGAALPCLRVIDEANRNPHELADIRARLDHGDTAGALTAVENLLGPEAVLRGGLLRDELTTAADRRVAYGLYRAGLAVRGPVQPPGVRRRSRRNHASR